MVDPSRIQTRLQRTLRLVSQRHRPIPAPRPELPFTTSKEGRERERPQDQAWLDAVARMRIEERTEEPREVDEM